MLPEPRADAAREPCRHRRQQRPTRTLGMEPNQRGPRPGGAVAPAQTVENPYRVRQPSPTPSPAAAVPQRPVDGVLTRPWSRADGNGVGAEFAFQQLQQGLLIGWRFR